MKVHALIAAPVASINDTTETLLDVNGVTGFYGFSLRVHQY